LYDATRPRGGFLRELGLSVAAARLFLFVTLDAPEIAPTVGKKLRCVVGHDRCAYAFAREHLEQ